MAKDNRVGIKLPDEKINDMFVLYSQGMAIEAVARTCKVAAGSVRKYRDRGDWAVRRQQIRERADKATDDDLVTRRKRWLRTGKALQQIGSSKFYDDKGKLKKSVIEDMTAGDGIRAIAEGVRIEREAIDIAKNSDLVITVKLPDDLKNEDFI